MKKNNGRLMLKIKKRRDSYPLPHKIDDKNCLNKENKGTKESKKRANPFSKTDITSRKSQKLNRSFDSSNVQPTFFFSKLESSSPEEVLLNKSLEKVPSNQYGDHLCDELTPELSITDRSVRNHVKDYFPLDWSIKHRVRFISKSPFSQCMNIKSNNVSKGISDFTTRSYPHVAEFSSLLHYWIHPTIPGTGNYPLKHRAVSDSKDSKSVINIAENKPFHDILMVDWKNSFQSVFNMLKTGYCPYFYLCSYQFCALFKAKGIQDAPMTVTVTPTTKGFREMLLGEEHKNWHECSPSQKERFDAKIIMMTSLKPRKSGVSFEMPYQKGKLDNENSSDEEQPQQQHTGDEKDIDLDVSLNDSNNDEFLDSIGLNKQQHFPSIQEQQRVTMKKKLQQLDKRPESTIIIKNCQGFFNFLLNSTFLCAPSGNMIGVPPTLISPSIFEGATLSKCKFTHGPVKHQNGATTQLVYCTDVHGFILPTQLKQMVDLLVDSQHKDIIIQTKSYELLQPLNVPQHLTSSPKQQSVHEQFGMTSSLMEYMNHSCQGLPDTCDIHYEEGKFKY